MLPGHTTPTHTCLYVCIHIYVYIHAYKYQGGFEVEVHGTWESGTILLAVVEAPSVYRRIGKWGPGRRRLATSQSHLSYGQYGCFQKMGVLPKGVTAPVKGLGG